MISPIDALAKPQVLVRQAFYAHGVRYRVHLTLPVETDILQLRGFHPDGSGHANTVFGTCLEVRPFLP